MAGEAVGEPQAEPGTAAEPAPVPGGQPPATGDPRVDAALARLGELAGLPVTEHPQVFNDVHKRLEDVLDELDAGQVSGPAGDRTAAGGGADGSAPDSAADHNAAGRQGTAPGPGA